jgi:hypothetical protein
LPSYRYTEKQIDRICNLILASKTPFQPQNLLEQILIDSTMEYIGRIDYSTQVKLQHEEMKSLGINISFEKMIKEQIALISKFNFHTIAGQRLREISAEEQILVLKSLK